MRYSQLPGDFSNSAEVPAQ